MNASVAILISLRLGFQRNFRSVDVETDQKLIRNPNLNEIIAIQDQLKTIEVSALISCIASICHVYMKFPLKINDATFFLS